MAYIPNYYVPDQIEQIKRQKGLANYTQTGNVLSNSQFNMNQDVIPLPAQYVHQNNYYARQTPEMGPPSQEDIVAMFRDMRRNPTKYSQEDLDIAKDMYSQLFGGNLFRTTDSNMANTLGNAAWELADTAAFGLLPDTMAEDLGLRSLSTADEMAKLAGMVGAFFVNPISPATTGTKVAGKLLPKAANFFKGAEGATTKVPKFLQAAMGGKTEIAGGMGNTIGKFLENPNVARRVGSALGGGFNFETGFNPLGLALGSFFPGGKAPITKADEVASTGSIIDEAIANSNKQKLLGYDPTVTMNTQKKGLYDYLFKNYHNPGRNLNEADINNIAQKFNMSQDEILKAWNEMSDWTIMFNPNAPKLTNYVTPRTSGRNDRQYLNVLNQSIDDNTRLAEQMYTKGLSVPKTKTEMAIAINDELQMAKANLSQIAGTNPEAARIITELEALWNTPIGKNNIIETAMKNMQGISPEFSSRFDDIWGVSSSLGRK